jgi:predicted GNAT family N-acyltransferase
MSAYKLLLLKDIINEMGEAEAKQRLSLFSCPLNPDVEKFLKEKAVEFEKQNISSTHLIYASYRRKNQLAGYFTLAQKQLVISSKSINKKSANGKMTNASKELMKKLKRFGTYNSITAEVTIPAPLIGQLGRNFSCGDGKNKLITGDELLKIACDKVWEMQRHFSGRIVYLECEDKPKLIEFYANNGFVKFGERLLDADEKDDLSGEYLVQCIKDLKAASEESKKSK